MPRRKTRPGEATSGRELESRRAAGERTWVGGCVTPPFFVTDRDEPYRVSLVAWMELPDGVFVAQDVVPPERLPGAVGRALRRGMQRPLAGGPRRPARIRVADATLAAEARAAARGIPVEVAPTPELDEVLRLMIEGMGEDREESDASYLDGDRLAPQVFAELFAAARVLHVVKPWSATDDDQILRVDVPALGVSGACISIIGALGETLGLVIFGSRDEHLAFRESADRALAGSGPIDLGAASLSLTFERGADLPEAMRREVARHRWPVGGADAYPVVARRDRDGLARPLAERDVRIATACAFAVATFFLKHAARFRDEEPEPVSETYENDDGLGVRLTLPYEAYDLFEEEPDASAGEDEGRALDVDAAAVPPSAVAAVHKLDNVLVRDMVRYAMARFGRDALRFRDDFEDADKAAALAIPWSVYGCHLRGRPVVDWFLQARGRTLGRKEQAWLQAQTQAWLSVWEVVAVEPGVLTLRDLLSGEVRQVREAGASKTLVVRDALLARVVENDAGSVLCGTHPRPLPPHDAAEVVRRVRGRLRRQGDVPPERLRGDAIGRYLIRRWEDAVAQMDVWASVPPTLQNTDGDPILFTMDRFELKGGSASQVEERLAAMPDVQPPDPRDDPPAFVFFRAGHPAGQDKGTTLIGRAWIAEGTLRLETNSIARADALRERIEAACKGLLRHRIREHTDPLAPGVLEGRGGTDPGPPPPEVKEALREMKRRHYATWPDLPVPALGDRTPRDAVRRKPGRDAVDVLIKDMENCEQRLDHDERYDFSELRRELGLDD